MDTRTYIYMCIYIHMYVYVATNTVGFPHYGKSYPSLAAMDMSWALVSQGTKGGTLGFSRGYLGLRDFLRYIYIYIYRGYTWVL